MTQKINILFTPADSGSSRQVQVSKKLLFAAAGSIVFLSLLGYYFLFSGALFETKVKRDFRKKLAGENFQFAGKGIDLKAGRADHQAIHQLEKEKVSTLKMLRLYKPAPVPKRNRENRHPKNQAGIAKHLDSLLQSTGKLTRQMDSLLQFLQAHKEALRFIPISLPVSASSFVIRSFGKVKSPFSDKLVFHEGVDFSGKPGDGVFAPGDAEVLETGNNPFYGKYIRLRHGNAVETFYAHLKEIRVNKGQQIKRRQRMGAIGDTGLSSGPHLHYEISINGEKVDPMQFYTSGTMDILQTHKAL